jgi:hypothetical protein
LHIVNLSLELNIELEANLLKVFNRNRYNYDII